MKTRIELDVIAGSENLKVVGTQDKDAIIGFGNWEQATRMAEQYGLKLDVLERRDGEPWRRTDSYVGAPLDPMDCYNDDYLCYRAGDANEFFESEVRDHLTEMLENHTIHGFDDFKKVVDNLKDIYDRITSLDDNEMVVVENDRYGVVYRETERIEAMECHVFSTYYAIGLVDPNDYDGEEDEER